MKKFAIVLLTTLIAATAPAAAVVTSSQAVEERVAETPQPSIKINGSTIEFRSPDPSTAVKFEIFSITGQLIKTLTVKSAPVKVELPKGFYIVKCDSWTRRVMLK